MSSWMFQFHDDVTTLTLYDAHLVHGDMVEEIERMTRRGCTRSAQQARLLQLQRTASDLDERITALRFIDETDLGHLDLYDRIGFWRNQANVCFMHEMVVMGKTYRQRAELLMDVFMLV